MLSILVTILLARQPASAADTIAVGHPSLRRVALRIGADTTEVFATRDGQRQLVATEIETVAKTAEGYVVVFTGQSRRGATIDSVVLDPTTLAPIRHVELQPDYRATLTFRNGRLMGTKRDSTGEHTVDEAVPPSCFDFSILGTLMTRLPLSVGYDVVLRSFDVATMKNKDVAFSVVARERIAWHGRDVDAWKTVVDFGTHKVTRWLDATTGHELTWELARPNMVMSGIAK